MDEVVFVDPAASLYFGQGFRSTTGFTQDHQSFVVHYGPFYPFLLYEWMRIFGFGCLAVRSLSYLLMAITAVFVWLFVRRQRLINQPVWRLVLVGLILSSFGITHSYRMGRVDSLAMAIAASALLAATLPGTFRRLAVIGFIAVWMPITSPVLPVYAAILSLIVLAYDKRRWREVAAGAVGVLLGGVFLFLFYSWHGVWENYFFSSILGSVKNEIRNESLQERIGGIVKDPSFMICYALLAGLALREWAAGRFTWRSPIGFGVIAGASIPGILFLLGHYPAYYSWLGMIPVAVCLCASLEQVWPRLRSRTARIFISGALGIAFLGLPLFVGLALAAWSDRDPSRVEAVARRNIKPSDWVRCPNAAYYAVRRHTRMTFCGMYRLTEKEKKQINVVLTLPGSAEKLSKEYGGKWRNSGDGVLSACGPLYIPKIRFYLNQLYYFQLYRRVESGGLPWYEAAPSSTKPESHR
ncbi:MAG: hypothetical protein JXB10_09505 [Pirellulales bacterium]|nr:hypothetical protein [Pirellulales bacterium]